MPMRGARAGGGRMRGKQAGPDDKSNFRRRPSVRRKVCRFCADKEAVIDYKEVRALSGFITERGKMYRAASPEIARNTNADSRWRSNAPEPSRSLPYSSTLV
jgi:ribosomal protein S18